VGYEDKRKRVEVAVAALANGQLTLARVEYADRTAVAVAALDARIIEVADVPPKIARSVAMQLIKDAPWRQRDIAADTGTSMHEWAERIALETATLDMVPAEIQAHVGNVLQFWKDFGISFEAAEFTVYSRAFGYAGTGDFLARSSKFPQWGLVLGDYKSSKSGLWPDIALQLAALRYAEFIGMPDGTEYPIPHVDTCIGVQVTADKYEVRVVEADAEVFHYFLAATQICDWKKNGEPTVLGKPVTP